MFQTAKATTSYNGLFTKKDLLLTTALSLGYLLLSKALVGFKIDQLVLVGIFNVMYYLSFPHEKVHYRVLCVYHLLDHLRLYEGLSELPVQHCAYRGPLPCGEAVVWDKYRCRAYHPK